jgi:putative SOS response-associated peptidase YedK
MTLTRSGREIAEYFALASDGTDLANVDGGPLRPRYNVAPTQWVPTIVPGESAGRALAWKRWGLVPSWSRDPAIGGRLFNARSETADTKPSFRSAWKRRRCLVVADGFYEWTPRSRGHQPYHFRSPRDPLLGLAGLFEEWHGEGGEVVESCTILTTEANADVAPVHHRMPVVLLQASFGAWLDPASDPDALKALVQPAAEGTLCARAVSRVVNDARHDVPACLDAAEGGAEHAGEAPAGQTELFRGDRASGSGRR